jgi:hypothetical protein
MAVQENTIHFRPGDVRAEILLWGARAFVNRSTGNSAAGIGVCSVPLKHTRLVEMLDE